MSQFWYNDETSKTIVDECIAALDGKPAKIACISCPSLVPHFLQLKQFQDGQIQIRLFEFDRRFEQKFPECFIFYDYNQQGPDFYVVKIVKYVHKYVVKNPKICRKICKICRKMAKYVITFIRLFELKFKKINNKSI